MNSSNYFKRKQCPWTQKYSHYVIGLPALNKTFITDYMKQTNSEQCYAIREEKQEKKKCANLFMPRSI